MYKAIWVLVIRMRPYKKDIWVKGKSPIKIQRLSKTRLTAYYRIDDGDIWLGHIRQDPNGDYVAIRKDGTIIDDVFKSARAAAKVLALASGFG